MAIPIMQVENLPNIRLGVFRFQPRAGSLHLKAISRTDVSKIIKRGDVAALEDLLRSTNIINAEVSEEDFDFHSSDFLVKLFQICQLSLEVGKAKNSMLERELFEVNRSLSSSEKNLRRQDEEVAMLRDELYHCKEQLKKAEEQAFSPRLFPMQERRVNSSYSELSGENDATAEKSIGDDATDIKLHIVSPTHGLYIPLLVNETCDIRDLHDQIHEECSMNSNFEQQQWCLYYKDQEVLSTGTIKDYHIVNDSALVILPSSSNTMESKLDDIKSMLNHVTNTLQCHATAEEQAPNAEAMSREECNCNVMLEEVPQADSEEHIVDITPKPTKDDDQNVDTDNFTVASFDVVYEYSADHPKAQTQIDDLANIKKMELKVDTTETDAFGTEEWPFGLNFDKGVGPPSEINATNGNTSETMDIANSPPKFSFCDCLGNEVCDECVDISSPRSSEAVVPCDVEVNDQSEEHFTFSSFDNIESQNYVAADYDFSCDKSDFVSLHIGAKESNVVTDSDLQSVDIEMSLEELAVAVGLEAPEAKKKKSRKKISFKSKWRKLMHKKKKQDELKTFKPMKA